jgi:hypothetical protein
MVKVLLIILVIAVLLEDGSSIKKTEEEKKEDEELAKAVNKTLAEEKEREEDEKKKRDEKKKTADEKRDKVDQQGGQSEAGPSLNCTCPVVQPCSPCQDCPVTNCTGQCGSCPETKECPEVKSCLPCQPCGPCPVTNTTGVVLDQPPTVICSEVTGMPTAIAMAVGAAASLLVTGVAAIIGLVIRYFSPLECGFVFLATIIIVWYFSSQYPETARELGARAATLLREAATTISHRIVEAIRHHNEQVSFPV